MEKLNGKYLVKLEVDWLYDGALNTGNLVVYASEGNVEIRQMENSKFCFMLRLEGSFGGSLP
jgi:hypothetical protein